MVCREKYDEIVFLICYAILSIIYFALEIESLNWLDVLLYVFMINPEIRIVLVELGETCNFPRDCKKTLRGEFASLIYSTTWLLVILIMAYEQLFSLSIVILLIMMVLPEIRFVVNLLNGKLARCPVM